MYYLLLAASGAGPHRLTHFSVSGVRQCLHAALDDRLLAVGQCLQGFLGENELLGFHGIPFKGGYGITSPRGPRGVGRTTLAAGLTSSERLSPTRTTPPLTGVFSSPCGMPHHWGSRECGKGHPGSTNSPRAAILPPEGGSPHRGPFSAFRNHAYTYIRPSISRSFGVAVRLTSSSTPSETLTFQRPPAKER